MLMWQGGPPPNVSQAKQYHSASAMTHVRHSWTSVANPLHLSFERESTAVTVFEAGAHTATGDVFVWPPVVLDVLVEGAGYLLMPFIRFGPEARHTLTYGITLFKSFD